MGLCSPLRAGTPTLNLLSSTRTQRRQRHPAAHGAGHDCPAPLPPLTWPPTGSRTRFSSPHQSVNTQPSKRGRSGGTMIVPPPPGERTHQSTQTPQTNTGSSANTQPQPPASKHAHSKPQQVRPQANTRNVPTPTRVGTPSVSAGGPAYLQRRPARTKRKRPTRARRTTHTTSAQTTRFAYGVRLRPQGRTAREKAAHNSPRQSAWVVVFVGVFADVCRLFGLVGFGGLGVFWGCLACFLVF